MTGFTSPGGVLMACLRTRPKRLGVCPDDTVPVRQSYDPTAGPELLGSLPAEAVEEVELDEESRSLFDA